MTPQTRAALRRPFAEQVAFFRGKLGNLVPTARWDDLLRSQHDRAFMVAGAARADLLADLADAVDRAIADGEGLEQFRARFGEIVQRRGWQGWTGSETAAGQAWRTRIIYQTNASTSYAAGRREQLKDFPVWIYRHGGSAEARPQHLAWDGLALPNAHPFWDTHSPPNGWGCSCYVVGANSTADAEALGGEPGREPPPGWDQRRPSGQMPGIDRGWDYAPGGAWQPFDRHAFTAECDGVLRAAAAGPGCIQAVPDQPTFRSLGLPRLRDIAQERRASAPPLLARAPTRAEALTNLAAALGVSVTAPRRWVDTDIATPGLRRILIHFDYLSHLVAKDSDARERYANFVLPTIRNPFEVWATRYSDGSIRPRLIGLFAGERQVALIVRLNRDGSLLYNLINANDKRLDDYRTGALLHGK